MRVARINKVWSADITYIRLRAGFVFLVAVINWYRSVCVVLGGINHHGRTPFVWKRWRRRSGRGYRDAI